MTLAEELRLASEILLAPVCQCGRGKHIRQAVCARCWRRLPQSLRRGLYSRTGCGFVTTYRKACEVLRREAAALRREAMFDEEVQEICRQEGLF